MEVSRRYSALQKSHAVKVSKRLKGDNSAGIDALAQSQAMSRTNMKLGAASREAKAIGTVLRDGHRKLSSLKRKLDDFEEGLKKENLSVDSNGRVSSPDTGEPSSASAAERHQERITQRERQLNKLLKEFSDADIEIKVALDRVSRPQEGTSEREMLFNGKAMEDIEQAKAVKFEELSTKLNSGDPLSASERSEFRGITSDAAKDRDLSKTLLARVGPEAFLKLSRSMSQRTSYDGENGKPYVELEKNLAKVLAAASGDSKFTKQWTQQFEKYGADPFWAGDRRNKEKGYQVLATLMNKSDGYSKEFLHGVADGIKRTEEADRNVWRTWVDKADRKGFANDPFDTVLSVMSKNPSAAASYLDTDMLKYIDKERNWDLVEQPTKDLVKTSATEYRESLESRSGFAAAIEAAGTGRIPGTEPSEMPPEHDESAKRSFERLLRHYSHNSGGGGLDEMHEGLRKGVAQVVADYPKDVYQVLGQYRTEGDETTNGLSIGHKDLRNVINAVSHDDAANRRIFVSQMEQTAQTLDKEVKAEHFLNGSRGNASDYANEIGRVFGTIDKARANAIDLELDKKLDDADMKKMVGYHAGGVLVTGTRYVGDGVQRLFDAGLTEYANSVKAEAADAASRELAYVSQHGVETVQNMFRAKYEDEKEQNPEMRFPDTDDTESKYRKSITGIWSSYAEAAGVDETMYPARRP